MSIISPWSQFSPPDRKQPRYQLGKGSLANRNGRGSMIPTNVRCIESTKAGKKTKIAWKTPRMGGFFFFRRLLFYELMCSSMLILRGNHMEGSQILFNSDSNSRSPSVCSSSGTWQLSKFGHRDPSFPSWLSNKKRWWLFWCHLCSLHGLSISKATGWCAFRRLLSLRRRF